MFVFELTSAIQDCYTDRGRRVNRQYELNSYKSGNMARKSLPENRKFSDYERIHQKRAFAARHVVDRPLSNSAPVCWELYELGAARGTRHSSYDCKMFRGLGFVGLSPNTTAWIGYAAKLRNGRSGYAWSCKHTWG